jgi:DNA recombination protein RmuC
MSLTIAFICSLVAAAVFIAGRALGLAGAKGASQQAIQAVRDRLTESEKRLAVTASRLEAYGDADKRQREVFAAIAGPVLESNSRQFLELAETRFKNLQGATKAELDARKTAIETLVAPLGQSLKELNGKVAELETKRIQAYAEVTSQIAALASANGELRTQTGNLVKALRSPNVRGNWGQMQLRRTVEIAGMIDYCDFSEQVSVDTDEGRLRPDMVVRLPADRRVVVDAKVPLMAYLESVEAPTEEAKSAFLKTHARQVRDHMAQLANKKYWEQFTPTPEFVVMFLPLEALFAVALQQDATLLEFGADIKVIPASPLTLIALLRAVNYGWKEASLARDAVKIQELGKGLYDSVRVLARHLGRMRDHLEGTVEAFNDSVGSIERNFLSRARKLNEFNAGGDEEIPQAEAIDARLRGLEAPELRQDTVEHPLIEGAGIGSMREGS